MTSQGGNIGSGYGVIFMCSTTGSYSVLYNSDGVSGKNPDSLPMQQTNGTIYGLALAGGTRGDGVFYDFSFGARTIVKLVCASGKIGTTVGILGGGFTGATSVTFNGKAAGFTVKSDSYLTATVPAGATTGVVKVTTPNGVLNSNTKFRVTPLILSFTPSSGPVGTPVMITGSGLTQTTKVTFGGVTATSFTVNSDTLVTATLPTGAKTGKIVITTPGGTATSTATFTVM